MERAGSLRFGSAIIAAILLAGLLWVGARTASAQEPVPASDATSDFPEQATAAGPIELPTPAPSPASEHAAEAGGNETTASRAAPPPRYASDIPIDPTDHAAMSVAEPTTPPVQPAAAPAPQWADTGIELSTDDLFEHLQALQDIADDNGGNRADNTPGYAASVAYVADRLAAAGYAPTLQSFTYPDTNTHTSENVLAETRHGDPRSVVVVGAHLDSVPAGPGIDDNGTGVAVVLELAEMLASQPLPLTSMIRFAFWGAEEVGIWGSRRYVEGLTPIDLDDILAYVNLDMEGAPNFARFVQDPFSSVPPSPIAPESRDLMDSGFAYFATHGLAAEPLALPGLVSDYAYFQLAGVPIGGLYTASPHDVFAYDPCYHLACDTIDNVNPAGLHQMANAVASVVLAFAMAHAEPDIDVEKSPSYQQIEAGSAATWTITVANSGIATLLDVVTTDANAPSCDRALPALAVGTYISYSCSAVIWVTTTNVISATAHTADGLRVTDDAIATVAAVAARLGGAGRTRVTCAGLPFTGTGVAWIAMVALGLLGTGLLLVLSGALRSRV